MDINRDNFTLANLRNLTAADVFLSGIPGVYYRLLKNDTATRTLANPQLRTSDGITAEARFGDEVPVPVTTFAPIAAGGINQQPITSFNYRTVGVNIDITPRLHHDDQVTLALKVSLSTQSGTGFGGLPTFGNREITTTIRLKDGETNMLAGLIRDEERTSLAGVPGLSDLPLIGHLFAYNHKDATQTDIILTLTPHIVRILDLNEADLRPFRLGRDLGSPTERAAGQRATAPRPRRRRWTAPARNATRRAARRPASCPGTRVPTAARGQAARHAGSRAAAEEAGRGGRSVPRPTRVLVLPYPFSLPHRRPSDRRAAPAAPGSRTRASATMTRIAATAPNVVGSLAVTPNSDCRSMRLTRTASADPTTRPPITSHRPSSTNGSHDRCLARAERHAESDLFAALTDEVRHHPVKADRRENSASPANTARPTISKRSSDTEPVTSDGHRAHGWHRHRGIDRRQRARSRFAESSCAGSPVLTTTVMNVHGACAIRLVELGIDRLAQAAVLRVGDDPDDLDPGTVTHAKSTADGVPPWPVLPGHRVVDQADHRRALAIPIGERTSLRHANPHDVEVRRGSRRECRPTHRSRSTRRS